LRGLVQLLRLVKDQKVAVLTASAVAGSRQKLDARTAFQHDLFAPERRFDLGNIPPKLRVLEKIAHFFKRLRRGLLQMRRVDHRLVKHQHTGFRAPLYQKRFAVLPGHAAACCGGCPFAGRCAAEPIIHDVALPWVEHRAADAQQLHRVHAVACCILRRDSFGRLLASHRLRGS